MALRTTWLPLAACLLMTAGCEPELKEEDLGTVIYQVPTLGLPLRDDPLAELNKSTGTLSAQDPAATSPVETGNPGGETGGVPTPPVEGGAPAPKRP